MHRVVCRFRPGLTAIDRFAYVPAADRQTSPGTGDGGVIAQALDGSATAE